MIKSQIFSRDYDKRYRIIERTMIKKSAKSLQKKYNSTIPIFLKTNRTQYAELFSKYYWQDFYKDLYVRVGLSFANWYAKYFDKWVETKSYDVSNYQTIWQSVFANVSSQISAKRIVGLSRTQRNNLNRIYSQKMRDPKFMALGVPQQTRILRNEMAYLSRVQATRIVRTETTTASNMAMRESATTIFPKESLMKEWQSSFLPTSRDGHMQLDGTQIAEHEQFLVVADDGKSDLMSFPGDPAGSAGNVCNCTCKVFYLPKTYNERVTGGDLTNTGFGLVSNTPGGAGSLVSTGVNIINPIAGGAGAGAGVAVNTATGSGSSIRPPKEIDDIMNRIRATQQSAQAGDPYAKMNPSMKKYVLELKKFGADLDDYISLINQSSKLDKLAVVITRARKNIEQYYSRTFKKMQLSRAYGRTSQVRTFIHEFGHTIDDYFNIGGQASSLGQYKIKNPIWQRLANKYKQMDEAKKVKIYKDILSKYRQSNDELYGEFQKLYRETKDLARVELFIKERMIAIYGDDVYKNAERTLRKFKEKNINPQKIRNEINRQQQFMIDTLDGLFGISKIDPRLGGYGHDVPYMNRKGFAEVVAEAFQYKYFGNYQFQKFAPDIFDDLIGVVDEWLASLPKQLANVLNYLIKKIKNVTR